MQEFNSSLLREKFIIHDVMPEKHGTKPFVAVSNRLALPLTAKDGQIYEHFVVRGQNMHLTARLGALIAREFYDSGPLLTRRQPFNWQQAYEGIIKGYESKWNPRSWAAIYHKGRTIFEAGGEERHPFLDIIEQCEARNQGGYEKSLEIAKDAFQQAGKRVTINYDSNVALVMHAREGEAKCGIIVRGPDRKTTFNFSARDHQGRTVRPSHCLSVAAAFLEGIQLAFFIGMTKQKLKYELIARYSEDDRKCSDAVQKLGRLTAAIDQFENMFNVSYRPDKPVFSVIVEEAEEFARAVLADEIKAKIASGDLNKEDWIV